MRNMRNYETARVCIIMGLLEYAKKDDFYQFAVQVEAESRAATSNKQERNQQ